MNNLFFSHAKLYMDGTENTKKVGEVGERKVYNDADWWKNIKVKRAEQAQRFQERLTELKLDCRKKNIPF